MRKDERQNPHHPVFSRNFSGNIPGNIPGMVWGKAQGKIISSALYYRFASLE
jgi:hypothetical protein